MTRSKTKLNPAQIVRGVILLLVGGWLASVVVSEGIAAVLAERNAPMALRYAPKNPDALVNSGALELMQATPASLESARVMAREALRRSPAKATGYTILAFVADAENRKEDARRLAEMSLSMSRRDTLTHLWFVEYFSARGDIAKTLRQYDQALTTSASANTLMMPVLISAASDPEIQQGLVPILARNPVWRTSFLRDFIAKSSSPLPVVALAERLRLAGKPFDPERRLELAERLVREKYFAQAAFLMRRPAKQQDVNDGLFVQTNIASPFSWKLVGEYAFGATAGGGDQNKGQRGLSIFASRGAGGELARQLLLLEPGRYTLAVEGNYFPREDDSAPNWQLVCANGDGATVAKLALPAGERPAASKSIFEVAPTCTAQWLILNAPPPSHADGISGRIRRISIERLHPSPL